MNEILGGTRINLKRSKADDIFFPCRYSDMEF